MRGAEGPINAKPQKRSKQKQRPALVASLPSSRSLERGFFFLLPLQFRALSLFLSPCSVSSPTTSINSLATMRRPASST